MKSVKYVIGIDEAGRGPLAGPVAVGVAVVPKDFDWRIIPGVGDSKKVTEQNREAIFLLVKKLKTKGKLNYAVILVSSVVIDKVGIASAIKGGVEKGLKKLALDPKKVEVKLDGLLKAPEEYTNQETIIKGDAKEKVIGLASILAKVTRDTYMCKLAKKGGFSKYNFNIHKGYGTKKHCDLIKKHGLSRVHRRSFCKRFAR